MSPNIERVTEGCVLGEAPHWDVTNQVLYFVDIPGKNILRYVPATKKVTKASVAPKSATFIIPVEGKKDHFVVSLGNQLVIILWDGESKYSIVEELCIADNSPQTPNNKFNDGKCDSSGRLWAGTQGLAAEIPKTEPLGSLYSYDAKKQLKKHVDQIRIANGLAFNEPKNKMYYIDSLAGTIDQFDFDVTTGTLSNRRILFTLKTHNIPGMADGMAIDTDGNLWVAIFGGSRIVKIDGIKTETLLETINLPALQVTSAAFGGANLDELYVTTGALEIEGKKLPPPDHGATYKITGTGSKGLAAPNFKLN